MLAYGSGDSVQYIYNNFGRVTKETCEDNDTLTYRYNPLRITYDANGPLYVDYNGTIYYYVTNLQGDVIALVNTSGAPVVEYTYDAWGSILTTTGSMATTLGAHNPLRYRGYVYDTELGLYYLQSRYYNPVMGRFINADAYTSTGQGLLGNNMFAYCGNNPVMYCDDTGCLITEAAVFPIVILFVKCTAVVTVSSLFSRLVVETIDRLLDYSYVPFSTPSVHEAMVDAAEYTKNKSERNRNKHEEGNARRQQDQGGEKKKQKKNWVPRNGGKIKDNGFRIY